MAEEKEVKEGTEKKSSSLVLIIIIVLVVLILLVGGVVAYMLMSKGDEAQQANPNGMEQQQQTPRKSLNDLTVGPMFPLDGFIVNLLSENGRRYLKATIDLELADEDVLEELGLKTSRIRDVIIRVLSSKGVEEISTPKGKEKLKKELTGQLNAILLDGQIVRVYFTDFVIQ